MRLALTVPLGHKCLPSICGSFCRHVLTARTALSRSWQVSSRGRVCNSFGVISVGSANPLGYLKVKMGGEQFYVHRVVAWTFLGPAPNEDAWQVHHIDGNPGNNCISNLEYVTNSQNVRHSHASGTRRSGRHIHSRPVFYRAYSSRDWTRCPSMSLAALELGVSLSAVSQACRGATTLKGYEMFFENRQEPALPGEEWKSMICPLSGEAISGRMVSSFGRLRLRNGYIYEGSLRSCYYGTRYKATSGFRTEYVHKIAAMAFLGPPPSPERSHVNHKDGDKRNNAACNLEYVTPAQNRAHYLENRTAQLQGTRRLGSKPVWSRACGRDDKWTWHPSVLSAATVLGLNRGSVSLCVRGSRHQSGGYEFRAADVFQSVPGEEWREVDVLAMAEEKRKRMQRHWKSAPKM